MTERASGGTYRRGLTLGLTMAEVFILILFLLLLLLMALYGFSVRTEREADLTRIELKETETELKKVREELTVVIVEREEMLDRIRSEHPEEIRELERTVATMKEKAATMEEEIAAVESEKSIAQALLEKSEQSRQDAERRRENAEKLLSEDERKLVGKVTAQERAMEKARNSAIAQRDRILAQLQAEKAENAARQEETDREILRLRTELYASKGIDPPCWYQIVNRRGKRHEKPHYLMDIAVHDAHLRVKLRAAPSGRAVDERKLPSRTSYEEEYAALPLEPFATVRNFSLEEFRQVTEPIRRMGKDERVRDYSCVFYAKVWDLTSATAKKRWQKAEDAIKNAFYVFRVREDPWPWR